MRATWLLVCAATTGCAVRATPYRFAGPLVGSVSLDDVAEHGAARRYDDGVVPGDVRIVGPPPGEAGGVSNDWPHADAGRAGLPGAPGRADVPATASVEADGSWRIVAENIFSEEAGGVVISRLPAPHLEQKVKTGVVVIEVSRLDEAVDLRELVGRRDGRGDVAFALAVAARLGGTPPAAIATAADGPTLVDAAREHDALGAPGEVTPLAGDLLIFDRAEDDLPASRVAIVIATDDRGVLEMIYLSHGVVRRGFVDPARPSTKRDADGKIVNTFLRDGDDHPPKGTRYLAGELLAHVVVWSRL